jgi:hypothetical protein
MAVPFIDGHIRQIRNIQVCRADLEPLLPQAERKFPSTTINAFGAYLQQVLNDAAESTTDPIIFSSWLGPIASGNIKDGGNEGSFEQHVMAAVSYY